MKKENILAAMMFGGQAGGGGGGGDTLFVTVTRDVNGDVTGSVPASEAVDAQLAGKNVIINLNDHYEDAGGVVKQFVAIPRTQGNYGSWNVVRTTAQFSIARAASEINASSDGWEIQNASAGFPDCLVIAHAGVPYFINNNDEEIIPDYMKPREEFDFGDTMGTLIVYAMQSANPEITLAVDLSAPGTLNIISNILENIRQHKHESPAILFNFTTLLMGKVTVSASLTNISTTTYALQESFNFIVQTHTYSDGTMVSSDTYDFVLSFEVVYDGQGDPKQCAGTLTCKKNTATIVPMS